ncbi:kinase-like protein [Meredithblackwellia eburnea MCA 4105]
MPLFVRPSQSQLAHDAIGGNVPPLPIQERGFPPDDYWVPVPNPCGESEAEVLKWEYQPTRKVGSGTTAEVYFARRRGTDGTLPDDRRALKIVTEEFAFYQERDAFVSINRAIRSQGPQSVLVTLVCGCFAAQDERLGLPTLPHKVRKFTRGIFLLEWLPYSLEHLRDKTKLVGISSMDLKRAVKLMYMAVEALHQIGVQHYDIKCENIRVAEDGKTPKLLDFGGASAFVPEIPHKKFYPIFTVQYTCPEALFGEGGVGDRQTLREIQSCLVKCKHQDTWGLMCVAYELWIGCSLFDHYDFEVVPEGIDDIDDTNSWRAMSKRLKEVKAELSDHPAGNRDPVAAHTPSNELLLTTCLLIPAVTEPNKFPTASEVLNSGWLNVKSDDDNTFEQSNNQSQLSRPPASFGLGQENDYQDVESPEALNFLKTQNRREASYERARQKQHLRERERDVLQKARKAAEEGSERSGSTASRDRHRRRDRGPFGTSPHGQLPTREKTRDKGHGPTDSASTRSPRKADKKSPPAVDNSQYTVRPRHDNERPAPKVHQPDQKRRDQKKSEDWRSDTAELDDSEYGSESDEERQRSSRGGGGGQSRGTRGGEVKKERTGRDDGDYRSRGDETREGARSKDHRSHRRKERNTHEKNREEGSSGRKHQGDNGRHHREHRRERSRDSRGQRRTRSPESNSTKGEFKGNTSDTDTGVTLPGDDRAVFEALKASELEHERLKKERQEGKHREEQEEEERERKFKARERKERERREEAWKNARSHGKAI